MTIVSRHCLCECELSLRQSFQRVTAGSVVGVFSPHWLLTGAERDRVQTREWILVAAVIVIPLIIAVVVTLWSLEQVRYRPKKRRPVKVAASGEGEADGAGSERSAVSKSVNEDVGPAERVLGIDGRP